MKLKFKDLVFRRLYGGRVVVKDSASAALIPFSRDEVRALVYFAVAYPTEEMTAAEWDAFGRAIDKLKKHVD